MKEVFTDRPAHTGNGTDGKDSTALVTTEEVVTNITLPSDREEYSTFDETGFAMSKRRGWRMWLFLGVAVLLVAAALFFLLRPGKGLPTATVRRGTIISSVETTGKLEAQRQARLSFKQSGRVEVVNKEAGADINVGDVLAELDTTTLKRQLNEATVQLEISKLELERAKEGAQPADIAAATADLNAAISRLNQVKSGGRAEDIASAQALLNQAQSKLDALKKGPSAQDLAGAQARLDQAKANRSLAVSKSANDKEQARLALEEAQKARDNGTGTQAKLDQAKSNYEAAKSAEVSQVSSADASVREAEAALSKLKAGATADELKQAEAAVSQATANLNKVKAGATDEEIAEAQSRVDAARAVLDKVMTGPTTTDLAILEQGIALAQLAVDNANAQLAESRLVSPIKGTLLEINLEVGEVISGLQPVATVADTTTLRIEADIDEIDIGRVSTGQAVTVTLDAYPGIAMKGEIVSLSPGASQKQGSTVYGATINFTPAEGVVPRAGMAANVDITAQRKDNVLLLPNRAFETVGGRQYVTVTEGGNSSKVEVETGLSNTTDTEIVSGLREGQVVVTR
ncbi:MAG TPA: HlyD family efflux transporter periplasmic adaptor subunit [Chloroflexia bacterium]|nr:HlyD family efflux transporter periplasmic adaptor subunit [Chloroflexia bacterium]